jgi:hypothetical protein
VPSAATISPRANWVEAVVTRGLIEDGDYGEEQQDDRGEDPEAS